MPTKVYVTSVTGLNKMLASLKHLDKDAVDELKAESTRIATDLMVPSYQNAARTAGGWGEKLAASVRAKKDRVPSVQIGYARKVFSGGASSIMLRHPTSSGHRGRPSIPASHWLREAEAYKPEAFDRWKKALDKALATWDRGPDFS